jgi:erythromycin esterase-like protein
MTCEPITRRATLRIALAAAASSHPFAAWAESLTADGDAVLVREIARAAELLPRLSDPAFGRSLDRFAAARVVLLGEATHGTSEFYRARAEITKHLIQHHGFTIVAVEADWPDASHVDTYIRGRERPVAPKQPFRRFPTWMWRNEETRALVDWLKQHNEAVAEPVRQVGFYPHFPDAHTMG